MFRRILSFLCLALLLAASAYAGLEVPASGSCVSGMGYVSGWRCNAGTLTFTTDNGPAHQLAYGISRPDTGCGNSGFIAEFNWNLLSNGQHTI